MRLNLANETRDVERDLKFHQTFQRLRGYLNQKSGKDISVELANQVFTNKKFYLENSYLNESQKYYGAPAKSFDFGKDGKKFKDEVNKWVQEKTKVRLEIKMIIIWPNHILNASRGKFRQLLRGFLQRTPRWLWSTPYTSKGVGRLLLRRK